MPAWRCGGEQQCQAARTVFNLTLFIIFIDYLKKKKLRNVVIKFVTNKKLRNITL